MGVHLDVLDSLVLSASRCIQEAEAADSPVWAESLHRLAEKYISEISRIAASTPICMNEVMSQAEIPPCTDRS